ncbi:hypothetical protein [Spirosoma sp. KNUC1025]|uniref:hypothetical protein n=1 Tax=Spirosoma sp. KNUC1025 TaxID=2894082 RepID=UPI001E3562DF|nr:hypothetical protein [Spirosoma sp. KNUC1025]UFH57786.1 hypothetical protein LN737_32710 [Spirosoma sp. KNUC1025]
MGSSAEKYGTGRPDDSSFGYMHEEETRRGVSHQLTQIANMPLLADELNLARNGLVRYATKEDLLVMARSKQL